MTDDDNDDRTPRERVVSDSQRVAHFAVYPPGARAVTAPGEDDLHVRVGRLEERVGKHGTDLASLLASRRTWRWIAGLGLPVLLTAGFTILLYSVDKIASSSERVGATAAKIEDMERLISTDKNGLERLLDKLDQDIRELRKHAGLDDHKITSGTVGANP